MNSPPTPLSLPLINFLLVAEASCTKETPHWIFPASLACPLSPPPQVIPSPTLLRSFLHILPQAKLTSKELVNGAKQTNTFQKSLVRKLCSDDVVGARKQSASRLLSPAARANCVCSIRR